MRVEDQDAFLDIVVGFAELKGKQLSAPALELYWRSMRHWTLEEFRAAAEHLLRTCEFMPVPKNFEDLRRASLPTAGEAWRKALAYCESGAWRRNDSCGDEVIDAAVRALGGYGALALCDLAKLGFLERRFCEHYAVDRDVAEARGGLPAVSDRSGKLLDGPGLTKLVES